MTADGMDDLVSFNKAAEVLPKEQRPSLTTWWRWWRKGIRGVRLHTTLRGGRRLVKRSDVLRFFQELTDLADGERLQSITSRQRQRQIAKAEKEVRQNVMGVSSVRRV